MKAVSASGLQSLAITSHSDLPLHRQLQGELRRAITEQFEDGQPFWTEATLTQSLGVSRGTVRQALGQLTREGLLVRKPSTGSVVCKAAVATTVAVLVPRYDSDFFSVGLEQLTLAANERGVSLQAHYLRADQDVASALSLIKTPPTETRVVFLGCLTRELHAVLQERGFQTLSIDSLLPGYTGRFVGTDNALGMRLGLQHLVELGHRDITLLVNEPDVLSVCERVEALQKFASQHELNARIVQCQTQLWQDSFEAALAHMDEAWDAPRPTALFAVSETGALAAIQWLSRRGVRVPDDVSVLGFGDFRAGRFTHPPLSTVAHPLRDIAERALDCLFDPLERQEFLAPSLIVRESTGKANSHSRLGALDLVSYTTS